MKTAMKKLKNRKGETLMETLVAILVFTLSSVLLYSMASTATDINRTARQDDKQFQEQVVAVEQAKGSKTTGTVSITIGSGSTNVNVDVYRSGDLYAYYVTP